VQVDGIIISTSHSYEEIEHFSPIMKKNIPFIFFDRKLDIVNASSVTIDDYQGGFDATQNLIDQGCKRIAHLRVDKGLELYELRFQGYKDALLQNGLEFNPDYVMLLKSDMEAGKEAAERLMQLPKPPDAIFSSTDNGLLGAFKHLQSLSIKIPDDFCIVGFSNEPFTQFVEPSISSIDQSPVEMGKMAAQVFLEHMENGDTIKVHKNVVLPAKLIVRKSSTRLVEHLK